MFKNQKGRKKKLSIFTDDMILYVENPREPTNKLPKLQMFSQGYHLQNQYIEINYIFICQQQTENKISEKILSFSKRYL